MANVPDVIQRARAYAEASNRSISTVSRLLFGNGNRIDEIERGSSSVRVDILQRASDRLSQMERAQKRRPTKANAA